VKLILSLFYSEYQDWQNSKDIIKLTDFKIFKEGEHEKKQCAKFTH